MESNYNVGVYVRLSKKDDENDISNSIINQKDMIKSYLDNNNDLTLIDYYIDDGYSGLNFERPEFKRMMIDILSNKINTVIVKDLSRFGREYTQTCRYLETIFPSLKIRFISIIEQLDNKDNVTEISDYLQIKNLTNDLYAKDIFNKVKSINEIKMKNNQFIGSFAPYGYKYDKISKKFLMNDYSANVVRNIFEMTVLGKSKNEIANILKKQEIVIPSQYIKNKSQNSIEDYNWNAKMIGRILTNESYIGTLIQNRSKKINYKINIIEEVQKDEWQIIKNHHEKIISEETFEKVQKILSKNKSGSSDYLLGFLRCDTCNSTMTVKKSKGKTYYYCSSFVRKKECTSHSILKDKVELLIIDELKKKIDKDIKEITLDILINNVEEIIIIDKTNLSIDYIKQ